MAIAETAKYEELVLTVEFVPGSGNYPRICGLTDFTISRVNNTETSLVPDCADESLPHYTVRAVQSQDTTISATGTWSRANHADVYNWFKSGSSLNVQVTNAVITANGTAGDPEVETIPMILSSLSNERVVGQTVKAEMEFQQSGPVTVTEIA